jgi:hypothetical protein
MPIAELMTFLMCISALLFVGQSITLIGLWKLFVKAGRPGWPAIIPLYRDAMRNDIAGVAKLWTYGEWALYAGVIIGVYVTNMILESILVGWMLRCMCNVFTYGPFLKAYNRDTTVWHVIIAVLFPYITFPRIGFSEATYVGANEGAPVHAPIVQSSNDD